MLIISIHSLNVLILVLLLFLIKIVIQNTIYLLLILLNAISIIYIPKINLSLITYFLTIN